MTALVDCLLMGHAHPIETDLRGRGHLSLGRHAILKAKRHHSSTAC
jgi:hypothetical protein